ncbi:hypothetical protein MUN74_07610 [Agromyces endophyticus]|uniref:hypothetical protein n=1 Tax=Agromyces sp. H17E-10 TaxID=2932244 RepID=UPI001FD37A52|nr:hypothetical protein [Agromyces sp. H17E-10]UOQ90759.1 hypothetical protein MUN74_07610 [Agromyces sp. H17E-10]
MRDSTRAERRRAKEAIAAVRDMEGEVRRMAKHLPRDARGRRRLDAAVGFAEAGARAAEAERRRSPRLAALLAERAAARLDRMSIRYAPGSGARAGHGGAVAPVGADAAQRARRRAKLVARRRKQADQVRKMATRAAALTIAQSIVVPNDKAEGRGGRAASRQARGR